ncbi:hypothetical protein RUND412_002595, partial [Rhizina undulata]
PAMLTRLHRTFIPAVTHISGVRIPLKHFSSGYGDPGQTGYDHLKSTNTNANSRNDMEHPGPPPVSEGQHEPTAKNKPFEAESDDRPQPKILDAQEPGGKGNESVEKHNKDFKQGYDHRGPGEQDEKVEKGYWKGGLVSIT